MPQVTKQKIYGYVDLTPEMRQWIKRQIQEGKVKLALGWRVIPAHFRENPNKLIVMQGYPDCEESYVYWFDNPEKRDLSGMEVLREPIPLRSTRDKEYFESENAKFFPIDGFHRYTIFQSRRNYVQEYVPEADWVPATGKQRGIRKEVADNVVEETKVSVPVKKSKTETRLVQ